MSGWGKIIAVLVVGSLSAIAARADTVLYYSGQFDLPIPADPDNTKGSMDPATIHVPDHFILADLDITVNVTHSKAFDLQLYLSSPAGTAVVLNMYQFTNYIEGADYSGTTFDDEAAISIRDALPPFEGSYRPLESLAAFDGEDAYGPWTLSIYDAYYGDTGHFGSFTLAITTPEPATVALLALGLALTSLMPPRGRKGREKL
ncbi:MAG: hypothetical protein A2Y77_05900 [Planctomycetes bacterium RBG_13_62_9]|nr:MAG: hypothetical protein A2Y77_05900 [Planctomycetes bacterium RBG_13_62_9]